jgi:hypothetical protein
MLAASIIKEIALTTRRNSPQGNYHLHTRGCENLKCYQENIHSTILVPTSCIDILSRAGPRYNAVHFPQETLLLLHHSKVPNLGHKTRICHFTVLLQQQIVLNDANYTNKLYELKLLKRLY